MIRVVSVENMRKSDARTIEGGIPGRELMLRAGRGVFNSAEWWQWFAETETMQGTAM